MTLKKESDSILARLWKALAPKADDPDNIRYKLTKKGEREVYGDDPTVNHQEDVSGQ